MAYQSGEIILLIGAGASADASIPTSNEMVLKLEELLKSNKEWTPYSELYHYLKSSLYYADGIAGKFDSEVTYNIERLVNALRELSKRDQHIIYPFIGNWNTKLSELAGARFQNVEKLENLIVEQLKQWVVLEDYKAADYYKGLMRLQSEYQSPLHVFSLNYDLCIERACASVGVERGFNEERRWDSTLFDPEPESGVSLFLYKMHGSIDWKITENEMLTYVDDISRNKAPQLIFGTNFKLQYIDPYLFFAYEFRRRTLASRIIITVGYGFGDEHINAMLGQALNQDSERKLIVSGTFSGTESARCHHIVTALKLRHNDQTKLIPMQAREYLSSELTLESLKQYSHSEIPGLAF